MLIDILRLLRMEDMRKLTPQPGSSSVVYFSTSQSLIRVIQPRTRSELTKLSCGKTFKENISDARQNSRNFERNEPTQETMPKNDPKNRCDYVSNIVMPCCLPVAGFAVRSALQASKEVLRQGRQTAPGVGFDFNIQFNFCTVVCKSRHVGEFSERTDSS